MDEDMKKKVVRGCHQGQVRQQTPVLTPTHCSTYIQTLQAHTWENVSNDRCILEMGITAHGTLNDLHCYLWKAQTTNSTHAWNLKTF